jgi:hypothetical protein
VALEVAPGVVGDAVLLGPQVDGTAGVVEGVEGDPGRNVAPRVVEVDRDAAAVTSRNVTARRAPLPTSARLSP